MVVPPGGERLWIDLTSSALREETAGHLTGPRFLPSARKPHLVYCYISTFLPYSVSGVAVPLFPPEAAVPSLVCVYLFCSLQIGSGCLCSVSLPGRMCPRKVLRLQNCMDSGWQRPTGRGQHCIHHSQQQLYIDFSLGRLGVKCVQCRKQVSRQTS